MRKKIITLCSWSELPCGMALKHSVEKFCPSWDFEWYLLDAPQGTLPVSVQHINKAEIPNFENLSHTYTYEELRSYVKFWMLNNLLSHSEALLYLDPLSVVVSPISMIEQALQSSSILLFPFLSRPLHDSYYPDEKDFLNKGLSDPSILAVKNDTKGHTFVQWMLQRLQDKGSTHYAEGLGSERLWLMHTPVFFEGVQLMHHSGYHVSMLNLHEYQANDRLTILNFRGNIKPHGHPIGVQNRNSVGLLPVFRTHLAAYLLQLKTFSYSHFQQNSPAFGRVSESCSPLSFRYKLAQFLQRISYFIQNKTF
ncbi:MAG: hypothetical protein U0Y10_18825 [Spirosomataceae bacterium]